MVVLDMAALALDLVAVTSASVLVAMFGACAGHAGMRRRRR